MDTIFNFIKVNLQIGLLLCLLMFCSKALAVEDIQLLNIQTQSIPGNKAQILLEFSKTPPSPQFFSLSNPSKLIFDFAGVKSKISAKNSIQKITAGVMTGFNLVSSAAKTRLIVDVLNIVPYNIEVDRNRIVLTIDNDLKQIQETTSVSQNYTISSLDFRRGELGEGRIIVEFAGESVPIDFNDSDNNIVVEFKGATIADALVKRFDVKDFGTNIDQINVTRRNNNVIMDISSHGDFEKIGYQSGQKYIIETKPLSAQSLALKSQKVKFTGEKISLNFQDIPVRSVIQLIADFTDINIVTSDSVQGNLTLKLDNIPWDQALDFILRSKGLAKRESDNVMLIGPNEEISAREQLDFEAQQQTQALIPLTSEYIQINFAKAADLSTIIKDSENTLLSERGQVNVDERTNTLWVKDTAENLVSVKQLIERLDVPVKQVMIEAQIVQTTDSMSEDLGFKFNGAATPRLGKYPLGVAPTIELARKFANDPSSKVTINTTSTTSGSTTGGSTTGGSTSGSSSGSDSLFFDFAGAGLGKLGLALAKLPGGTLLDLELRASELENKSKTVARPKLMTLDQQQASIETGTDIPYTTVAQSGATPTTTFKKAVLKLDVTPQITPNNKISMSLTVNQDTPGADSGAGPAINTTSLTTNILVDDGETIVLGGIFSSNSQSNKKAIPILSDIPIIGRIFRVQNKSLARTEVLIFITPRIVKNMLNS